MKKCNDQNRAVKLVFEKKLGWLTRILFGVPCIAGILLIFASLGRALGDSSIVLPSWVIPTLLFTILAWTFVPIRFQIFLNTKPSCSVLTHIRIGFLAVGRKAILCDRVKIKDDVVNVVFDEVDVQIENILCIHGENSVAICSSWARWFLGINDVDMKDIYNETLQRKWSHSDNK